MTVAVGTRCGQFVKSIDMYGHPFNLTFKGEETYNTCLGATMTFFVYAVFMAYFFFRAVVLVRMSDNQIIPTLLATPIDFENPQTFDVWARNFSFGYQFSQGISDDIATIQLLMETLTRDDNNTLNVNQTLIEVEECGTEGFIYENKY